MGYYHAATVHGSPDPAIATVAGGIRETAAAYAPRSAAPRLSDALPLGALPRRREVARVSLAHEVREDEGEERR